MSGKLISGSFDFAGLAEEAEEAETHGTRVNVNKNGTLNNIHVSCVFIVKCFMFTFYCFNVV